MSHYKRIKMNADKKQILICGNYGAGNLGDEAILDGILRLMNSTWPNVGLSVLSADPSSTRREHKISSVYLFPSGFRSMLKFWLGGHWIKTIHALKKADLVILGGGGLFTDEKWQAIWIWYVQAWWFWIFRKKLVCLGQSVGPLKSNWSRYIARKVFSRALMVSVRDKESASLLKEIGIANARVLSDPAFALAYEHETARNIQAQIVLSLRDWPAGKGQDVLPDIARTIDWLWQDHHLKTVFVPFQDRVNDDILLYERLSVLVKVPEQLQLKRGDDYKQAMEIIGRSKLVLGMRLHSLIFAVLENRPFVAISYSTKVKNMMSEIKMADYCLDYPEADFAKLKSKLEKTLIQESLISRQLAGEKMRQAYLFFEHEKLLKAII